MSAAVNTGAISKQTTVVHLASSKLEWTITKFDKLMKLCRTSQDIVSQRFSSAAVPDVLWELHVYPKGKREEDNNCVSFFLRQVGMKTRKDPIMTEFRILCSTPSQVFSVCRDVKEFVHQQGRGKFKIPHEKITSCLTNDGSLQLVCEIEYVPPSCQLDAGLEDSVVENEPFKVDLSFEELLGSSLLSDFVIECGGEKFNCHRCILAAHSVVFRSMFDHKNTNESRDGVLSIVDSSAGAVRGLLQFMYRGSVDKLADMANDLLVIAEKYDVSKLKSLCERQLISKLTAANVCQLLMFADVYSADRLKEASLNFLRPNLKTVLKTKEWQELRSSNGAMASDLMEWILKGGEGRFALNSTHSAFQSSSAQNDSDEVQMEKTTSPPPRKRTRKRL